MSTSGTARGRSPSSQALAGLLAGVWLVAGCGGGPDAADVVGGDEVLLDTGEADTSEPTAGDVEDTAATGDSAGAGVTEEDAGPARDRSCDDGDLCTLDDRWVGPHCVGEPIDCTSLDGPCVLGFCEPATGICGFSEWEDGAPCDDGHACTGADRCASGVCGGDVDACGPCDGLEADAECDDGDACTETSTCLPVGDALVCVGEPLVCPSGGCSEGVCDPADGSCSEVAAPDGAACVDDHACTTGDQCIGGVCSGAEVPTCTEDLDTCEAADGEGSWSSPVAVDVPLGATVVLRATIAPSYDEDWFLVEFTGGEQLSATVADDCEPAPPVTVTVDGGLVHATTGGLDGTGAYLLQLTRTLKPPCQADSDCDCPATERCEGGDCLPRFNAEGDDRGPIDAAPLALDSGITGQLEGLDDIDVYALELTAGQPITVRTAAPCVDEAANPLIAIYDGLDLFQAPLVSDSDGGPGVQALLDRWVAPADGKYALAITSENATPGAYALEVLDATCATDADCGCDHLECTVATGLCVPINPVPEGAEPELEPGSWYAAQLGVAYEIDEFGVALDAGTWTVSTDALCAEVLDTRVAALDGETLLAEANHGAGGTGFFAVIEDLTLDQPAFVTLRVSAAGPATGSYRVAVHAVE